MRKIVVFLNVLLLVGLLKAGDTSWTFDVSHSKIGFSVTHMMITDVEGQFGEFDGKVMTEGEDFTTVKIDLEIDVNSVNTANEKRDVHLRNEDFFDTAKFPKITFKSTQMEKVGDEKYKLTGDFTMMGVTKPVTLDVIHNGTIKDPWGGTRAGFDITGKIDRTDFGLKYNSVLDAGGLMIGEDVKFAIKIQLKKAK